jgi:uncharacterized protein YoxC
MDKQKFQMLRAQVQARRAQRKLMQEGEHTTTGETQQVKGLDGETYTIYKDVADLIQDIQDHRKDQNAD